MHVKKKCAWPSCPHLPRSKYALNTQLTTSVVRTPSDSVLAPFTINRWGSQGSAPWFSNTPYTRAWDPMGLPPGGDPSTICQARGGPGSPYGWDACASGHARHIRPGGVCKRGPDEPSPRAPALDNPAIPASPLPVLSHPIPSWPQCDSAASPPCFSMYACRAIVTSSLCESRCRAANSLTA